MRSAMMAAALIMLPVAGHTETRVLKTVDFSMPSDIRAQIPRSVKKEDIFVSDDFCFHDRQNCRLSLSDAWDEVFAMRFLCTMTRVN